MKFQTRSVGFFQLISQTEHLYVHLPFCSSRCHYCDFFSETGSIDRADGYIRSLLQEFASSGVRHSPLSTVYLGGGTPSLLPPVLTARLLKGLLAEAVPDSEVTIEANPSTVTGDLAEKLIAAGCNRISLGAQSFNPRLRKNLGRAGEAEAVGIAVSTLRRAGFTSISLDMMYGIPAQTIDDLRRDIDAVQILEPQHISYYELSTKKGSSYERRWQAERAEAAAKGRLFYETVVESLEAGGYGWYETSNFALPGFECRHNLAYWRGKDYTGLGAGAWSTAGRSRWKNVDSITRYMQCESSRREYEKLSDSEKERERLILGLRCQSGIDLDEVSSEIDHARARSLTESGFLHINKGRLSLTREGRFVANEISAQLLKRC